MLLKDHLEIFTYCPVVLFSANFRSLTELSRFQHVTVQIHDYFYDCSTEFLFFSNVKYSCCLIDYFLNKILENVQE